jgi:transcriptional regulator with PAS, ATPase and Fis domain
MFDFHKWWRRFLNSQWLQAGAIASAATILAIGVWAPAPVAFATLDWSVYDYWMSRRAPVPVSPSLVIVTRDRASEEEFGSGVWDRAVLARMIAAAHDGGAAATGLVLRLDYAGPPPLGGAASDALLLETVKSARPLVVIHGPDTPLDTDSVLVGHQLVDADPDRIARAVHTTGMVDSRAVPAFALMLYHLHKQRTSPAGSGVGESGPDALLVNYVGDGTLDAFPTIPASVLWNTIDSQNSGRLIEWFGGNVVVFLQDSAVTSRWTLPTGQSVSESVIQVHLLNTLLTNQRLCELDRASRIVMTLVMAGFIAWILLAWRGPAGLLVAGATVVAYPLLVVASLAGAQLVLPFALPITTAGMVIIGTAIWNQLTAHQRVLLLEQDRLRIQQEAAAVREAVALHETRAETLSEELAVARAAVEQSTDQQERLAQAAETLRTELLEVQMQEDAARRRLAELEQHLHGLQAATGGPVMLADAESDRLREECRQLGIVTRDPGMLRLYRDLKKGARSPLTVLLLGEPGTGKELFARAVHRLSPRTGKTFIAVNMAAISPELFESELFGHTKGSFTGATADRRGYFELANHGTLFLDEIGDLRPDHQGKLLRVLQEKSFYRIGATTPTSVDVRIVAATNRDLQRGVSEGWFREDLYFRLTGLVFRLPPLRERTGDIPVIADTLLKEIANQMGKPAPALTNEALQTLLGQEWKGNVRELRHCLEQAIALNDAPLLSKESLRLGGDELPPAGRDKPLLPDPAGDAAVLNCLRQHGFDMQATARVLGWDRSTVTQRLKGLCFQALVESKGDHAKAALAIAGNPEHLRTVELKLMDYYHHLQSMINPIPTVDEALAQCRRRFKNLPDRHFASVETLVRQHFRHEKSAVRGSPRTA